MTKLKFDKDIKMIRLLSKNDRSYAFVYLDTKEKADYFMNEVDGKLYVGYKMEASYGMNDSKTEFPYPIDTRSVIKSWNGAQQQETNLAEEYRKQLVPNMKGLYCICFPKAMIRRSV